MLNPIKMIEKWLDESHAEYERKLAEIEAKRVKDFDEILARNLREKMAKEKRELEAFMAAHKDEYLININVPCKMFIGDDGKLHVDVEMTQVYRYELHNPLTEPSKVEKAMFIELMRKMIMDQVEARIRAQIQAQKKAA